jgi:hypothetical protein
MYKLGYSPQERNYEIQNQGAYLVQFEKFIESLFIDLKNIQDGKINPTMNMNQHLLSIRDVVNFIRASTGYDIGINGEWQIALGLAVGYNNIVNMGMDRVKEIFLDVQGVVHPDDDWKDTWRNSVARLNLDFL